ncbi:hypothetical protein ACIBL3_29475 [Kribbella sp. NPDC050124]|uniref:hypothetical protein n=1 Tax=Kribbella sp. NPDC050124 TaxID=3364114 RepID=UPI00379F3231
MADREPAPDPHDSAAGVPRWVKVFGLLALAVLVLALILMLAGGHGPGRHLNNSQPTVTGVVRS